jgi:hypothetical protein
MTQQFIRVPSSQNNQSCLSEQTFHHDYFFVTMSAQAYHDQVSTDLYHPFSLYLTGMLVIRPSIKCPIGTDNLPTTYDPWPMDIHNKSQGPMGLIVVVLENKILNFSFLSLI